MPSSFTAKVGKVVFVVSVVCLAFFYGFAANTFEWFPNSILERAWDQAKVASPLKKPHYLTSRVYRTDGVRVVKRDAVVPGLTLISTVWEDFGWTTGLKLVDLDGRIIHEWRVDPTTLFADSDVSTLFDRQLRNTNIHGVHLFSNGDVVVNLSYVGVARLDACGRVLWQLPVGSHHSISRAEDGSFWIPTVRDMTAPEGERFPGLSRPLHQDEFLHVTEAGTILGKVNVLQVLYDNGLERYIAKADQTNSTDVTHVNDIEPLSSSLAEEYPLFEAGDLLVSSRNLDLVFVVDPDSWRVKWHASDAFIHQHDADFIGDGWIGVFDNNQDPTSRGEMLGGSRIIGLQPHTDSVAVLFPTIHSDPFYTSFGGKWQLLANGNMLLTEMKTGRVVEVTSEGRTVWEWIHEPYDESLVPEVTAGTRYRLSPEEMEEWPCSP